MKVEKQSATIFWVLQHREWIRYAFANSGSLTGIHASRLTAAASLTISTNDFQGITYAVASTGANSYIQWSHGATGVTAASNYFVRVIVGDKVYTGKIVYQK